jgi:predicted nucleic acid-binding protein
MASKAWLRFVIDANVLFEGLTKTGSASGLLIEAWLADLYQACVSTALAYEYVRDYHTAHQSLGLVVLTPVEAVTRLAQEER